MKQKKIKVKSPKKIRNNKNNKKKIMKILFVNIFSIISRIIPIIALCISITALTNSNLPLMSYNGDYFVDIGYYYPNDNGFLIAKAKEIRDEDFNYRIDTDSEKIANIRDIYGTENIVYYAPDLHFIKFYLTLENKGNGVANNIQFYSLKNNIPKYEPISLYQYDGIPSSTNNINISSNEHMNICFKICMNLVEKDSLKGMLLYSDINGNIYQDVIDFSVVLENNSILPDVNYKKMNKNFIQKFLCFFGYLSEIERTYIKQ